VWKWRKSVTEPAVEPQSVLTRRFDDRGMVIEEATSGQGLPQEATALLVQLEDEGLAYAEETYFRLDWAHIHRLIAHKDYRADLALLAMPTVGGVVPQLISRGSLIDPNFAIAITDWVDTHGLRVDASSRCGALIEHLGQPQLLAEPVWQLFNLVQQFSRREPENRNERFHRQAWGEIRAVALRAGARLDDFLYRTVVLAPDRLQFNLRKGAAGVVEVEPEFEGVPPGWLEAFDRSRQVLDRYDLPTAEGIIQVIPADQVKTVLAQIKAMPGRRISGAKAEAFLVNPIAALGPDAERVIDPEAFEIAKENAGIVHERFAAWTDHRSDGTPCAGLQITTATTAGIDSHRIELSCDEALEFVDIVRSRQAAAMQLCAWRDYEFELDGDSDLACEALLAAYQTASEDNAPLVRYADVHDLAGYSERIAEIGIEKPVYSPFIIRKSDEEGWVPQDILPVISWTPPGTDVPQAVIATPIMQREMRDQVALAQAEGRTAIEMLGLPAPMAVDEAIAILDTFKNIREQEPASPRPNDPVPAETANGPRIKIGLVLKSNINAVDYTEERRAALAVDGAHPPALPRSLRPDISLKDHQQVGIAWMQHMFAHAPHDCRGVVLADDMGLGKTLQLLCFIAAAREAEPHLPPALVVAPVSLLENWKKEVEHFFQPGALRVLTAYGDRLADFRVPQSAIDEQLRSEGLARFLKRDWCANADIVLTTYETLRDMEFSFARERWSIMVCDEAQKIKNPGARVTSAAKKQQTRFRIACTGTPVENSLVDLWCLYDFIQPGLLGSLDAFGKTYRRPIETETDEERRAVEELRAIVAPQILRRMKADVAHDLKAKIINQDCQNLSLSEHQRTLYANAIDLYRRRNEPNSTSPFANQLGLLHYMRLVCTDPQRPGFDAFVPDVLADYRAKAPKLDWLIQALAAIRNADEKAIIFCEFKNIQRLLRHYIQVAFGIAADIINGDTSASAEHVNSRQKRIDAFQQSPGFGVIILSPVAVGFGVNIQAANHVIHYTRTWNPAKEDQATDRAYRIGQQRDVHVYYPIVRADDFKTFDVRLDELLSRKRALAGDMLNGAGDVSAGEFELDDLSPAEAGAFADTQIKFEDVLRMNPLMFEGFAAALWAAQGWSTVSRTQRSADRGVDVLARTGNRGVLIQCKSTSSDRALNWAAVQEITTGAALYQRIHPSVEFELICFTNGGFNAYAHEQAAIIGVKLIERDEISKLMIDYPLRFSDIELFLS
jgi:hypothetical protein